MVERRQALRNRIVGVLLRDARERAGRTKAECAEALGIPAGTLEAYEAGRSSISLPELEVLGYLLDVPIDRFWDREPEIEPREPRPDLRLVMTLRHRIVGACLRRARLRAEMTQEELAGALGCSPKRVSDYERAEVPIPITELERVARFLNVPMEHFLDGQEGPVGEWHRQRVIDRRLQELPAEIQDFVAMPVNIKYLQVAMRLAGMSASRLRGIAEGLLEITY